MKLLILILTTAAAFSQQTKLPEPAPPPTQSVQPVKASATNAAPSPPKAKELSLDLQMELLSADNELMAAQIRATQEVEDAKKRGDANVAAKQAVRDAVIDRAQKECGPGKLPTKEDVVDEATHVTKKRITCQFDMRLRN